MCSGHPRPGGRVELEDNLLVIGVVQCLQGLGGLGGLRGGGGYLVSAAVDAGYLLREVRHLYCDASRL